MATVPNSTSVSSTSVPSTSAPFSSAPVTTHSGTSETSATAASPPAISSTQIATSTATNKPTHTAIGVGAGVGAGVGVAVGLAILAAGFFYNKHRPSKTRDEGLPAIRAGSNDKSDDRRPTKEKKKTLGELPSNEKPQELMHSIGHPLETSELHGDNEQDSMDLATNRAKASALVDIVG